MNNELTEVEQKVLALALFGHAMAAGVEHFALVVNVATKLGVEERVDALAKEFQREHRKQMQSKNND